MRVAANLATMFTDVPLVQRYARAANVGFRLVEVSFPYSVPSAELKAAAEAAGVKHVLINAPCGDFSAGDRGLAARPDKTQDFRASLDVALEYAKTLSCPRIHIMSGLRRLEDTPEAALAQLRSNLTIASKFFAGTGIQLLVEPINGYSIPGYALASLPDALKAIAGLENVSIMFDVFHIQQIHGQLSALIKAHAGSIGHVQVAQVPDRHEPDSAGEINYAYVFDVIRQAKPDAVIGCEYINVAPGSETVGWVSKYGLEF